MNLSCKSLIKGGEMNDTITIILLCGIVGSLGIIFFRQKFFNKLLDQEKRAIKFYLDRQLMTRLVTRLKDGDQMQIIIRDVREYFVLDNVSIFKVGEIAEGGIYQYIQAHAHEIEAQLSSRQFARVTMQHNESSKRLIIQYLDDNKKVLVIYVLSVEHELSKNDIEVLTQSVTTILNLAYKNNNAE